MTMQRSIFLAFALAALCSFAVAARAADTVLLDDTWATGDRSTQNLPTQSAWYANSSSTLTATTSTMTGTDGTGSAEWLTYFTPSTAQTLNVGDTLQVALTFNLGTVAAENTSRGVRIGLLDFSNGTRLTADSYSTGSGTGAPGANVTGYMLNMNMGTTFGINGPLQTMARSTTSDVNLMGASGDYTAVGSNGGGSTGDPGFADGTSYTLTFSVTRTSASSVDITTAFSGGSLNIANTVTDSTYNYTGFDTFAIRPSGNASGAATWNFTEMKVDYITPVPEPTTFALAGLGMLGLAAARRFRRS
jgi:PEP-CTERM motif